MDLNLPQHICNNSALLYQYTTQMKVRCVTVRHEGLANHQKNQYTSDSKQVLEFLKDNITLLSPYREDILVSHPSQRNCKSRKSLTKALVVTP